MLPWAVGGFAGAHLGWVVVVSAPRSGSGSALRPLRDEMVEMIAARMRVFAEPTRIRLLGLLDEGEATVQQLTDRMQTTHQNVSKHLGVLYQAGMVSRRKQGNSVVYALIDWTGWWLIEQIASCIVAQLDERQAIFRAQGESVG
jgi:DNA-binding transcriptional ArsR family regulator